MTYRLRRLSPGTVHVWTAIDNYWNSKAVHRLKQLEIFRGAPFLGDAGSRNQYNTSRAMIQAIMPYYLGTKAWKVCHFPGQRPIVLPRSLHLSLSLSHTDGLIAVAITRRDAIGVDVENLSKPERVTRGVFRYLCRCIDATESNHAIWEAWCRQEALLKGMGIGLKGMAQGTAPCACTENSTVAKQDGKQARWRIKTVKKTSSAIIACAVSNARSRIQVRKIQMDPFRR